MYQTSRRKLCLIAILALSVLVGIERTRAAEDRSLRWEHWDTTLENIDTKANSFQVTEAYDIAIEQGPFRTGTRAIPLDRITAIDNIHVSENGVDFKPACDNSPGTFCVSQQDGAQQIAYYFNEIEQAGDEPQIQIVYTVHGALRSYPDGDKLFWSALAVDRSFPVVNSTVTVKMPKDVLPQVVGSYPSPWLLRVDSGEITWTAPKELGNKGYIEVLVQYPHNPQMTPPPWQKPFDEQNNTH